MIDNYIRIRKTAPDTEPLTLSEAKENLRIESGFTDDDNLITAMISAARDHVEWYLNRYITAADVYVLVDELPSEGNPLYLPIPDLTAVTDAFEYTDDNGDEQTFSGTLTLDAQYQTVTPSEFWPSATRSKFTVTVGPPVEFPAVKQAMQLLVADMYELRTAQIIGTIRSDNPAVKMLLNPYRAELSV